MKIKQNQNQKKCYSRFKNPLQKLNKIWKQKINNPELIFSGLFFIGIFSLIIANLIHFLATDQQTMLNNSYNSRQELLLSQNVRGRIYSRDGEVLAETIVDDAQKETRSYPYGNIFSHVIGYSTRGRMGLENHANYYLINSNISLAGKAANDKADVKNPGDSVYTTLDVQLQSKADELLGNYRGAILVTEVKTGKILTMVSHPNFDPNEISTQWEALTEETSDSVLVNRSTQGLYPPGSTFKIFTALEYFRENPETFREYSFHCVGHYKEEGSGISCYHNLQHGNVDYIHSFAKSCNSAYANMGVELDKKAFTKTLEDLLFNQPLPLPFSYNASSISLPEDMTADEMIQTVIGQGKTQITPIHLNLITCAIANNGFLMEPYLIDRVESGEADVVKSFSPSGYGQLISEEEAGILKELMVEVVKSGTAGYLSHCTYTIAGKTGSAEYNASKESHAWFTGFAPVEDPEISITIIVEGAGSGSDYAVPIAKEILDIYFEEKN